MNCSFQHAALAVTDVDLSVEYYTNVFGFKEIPNLTKRPEIRWLSLGEGLELHLIQSDTAEIKVTKYVHLAWSASAFNELIELLEQKKSTGPEWPQALRHTVRADGVRQVFFKDPDGYWIEINNA